MFYPDQAFSEFLRCDITHGFRIGVNPTKTLRPAHSNLASVRAHPATVSEYIRRECTNGKLASVSPEGATQVRCNPIAWAPKPSQPGRFRLIVDLPACTAGRQCQWRHYSPTLLFASLYINNQLLNALVINIMGGIFTHVEQCGHAQLVNHTMKQLQPMMGSQFNHS